MLKNIKLETILIVLIILYLFWFTFLKKEEVKSNIIIKKELLNIDSLVSVLEKNQRLILDSLILENQKKIDSINIQLKQVNSKRREIEKNINTINSIIGTLPDL